MADNLRTLDLSGNVSLGNYGALQLLKACSSRFGLTQDADSSNMATTTTTLSLVACGIESPLSDEFVKVVKLLQSGDRTTKTAPFKVDMFGNLIDEQDMKKIIAVV